MSHCIIVIITVCLSVRLFVCAASLKEKERHTSCHGVLQQHELKKEEEEEADEG